MSGFASNETYHRQLWLFVTLKVHSFFSLLSLHHTYITNNGRLVGVISLNEVRQAVQGEVNIMTPMKMKDRLNRFFRCQKDHEGDDSLKTVQRLEQFIELQSINSRQ